MRFVVAEECGVAFRVFSLPNLPGSGPNFDTVVPSVWLETFVWEERLPDGWVPTKRHGTVWGSIAYAMAMWREAEKPSK